MGGALKEDRGPPIKETKERRSKHAASSETSPSQVAGAHSERDMDAGTELNAENERVLGASKKDHVLRRKELLGLGPKSLSAQLTKAVASDTAALLRLPHSCELVVEVARGAESGKRGEIRDHFT